MNTLTLNELDGAEIKPGLFLIGEPTPMSGTNKMRGLANVLGHLCVVELSVTFAKPEAPR